MRTPAGLRWGVQTPQLPTLTAVRSQPFARAFFNMWAEVLPTTDDEDRLVEQRWGVTLSSGSGSGSSVVSAAAGAGSLASPANLPRSKDHIKFEVWVGATKKLLQTFAAEGWQSMKESALKLPAAAAAQFYGTAGTEGHDDIHAESQKWMAGLGVTKKMLAAWREHQKRRKPSQGVKMGELADLSLKVDAFLRSLRIEPAASFKLFALRAAFVQQSVSEKGIKESVNTLIGRGLVDVFAVAPGGSATAAAPKVNASLWLRSVFAEVLADVLPKACKADELQSQAKALHDDFTAASHLLRGAFAADAAPTDFLDDLSASCVILAGPAGVVQHPTTVVKDAVARVKSDNWLAVRSALASPVWDQSMLAAAGLLQTSSKDCLADSKMARALEILRDPRLPQVTVPTGASGLWAAVHRTELLVNGAMLGALEESLLFVVEALALWSGVQAESQGALVKSWIEALIQSAGALNEVHWLSLAGCFSQAGLLQTGDAAEQELTAEAVDKFATALDEFTDDEEPLVGFCERASKTLASFPPGLTQAVGVDAFADKLKGSLAESIRLRGVVVEVALALSVVGFPLASPEQMVTEWRVKQQQEGTSQNAQLSRVLGLLQAVEKLRSTPGRPGELAETDVSVQLRFGEEDSELMLSASLHTAMSLHTLTAGMPCLANLGAIARDSLQRVLKLLAESVQLAEVSFALPPDDVSLDLGGLLATFFNANVGASLAKSAAKHMGSKNNDTKGWPFEAPGVLSEFAPRVVG